MSARRAMIRRERKQNSKIEKHKAMNGKLERAKAKGVKDGRNIAGSVALEVMHDKYKLSNEKAQQVLDCVGKDSTKLDKPGTRFVVQHYADMFFNKVKSMNNYLYEDDIEKRIYYISRNELYISTVAMLLTALNDLFNFSSNKKETGRLDYIMEYCANRYLEMQLDPEHKTADYYFQKMLKKTGYIVR